jgi:cholest-4-en-3-one 26-monooxygenase
MTAVLPPGYDFTDPDVNWAAVPHELFKELRRTAPVTWIDQKPGAYDGMSAESGGGYWALTRHADVAAVSKNSKDFSSAENGAIIRFAEGTQRGDIELQRVMILNQDPPEHNVMRRIVSRGFTPRAIGSLEDGMRSRAARIVADARARGEVDFVTEVAAELPLQAIADLLGVPQEDRKQLFHWSNSMLGHEDPDFAGADSQTAATEMLVYAMAMAADRTANPGDDIVTRLIEADKDGRGLNDDEFGYFVIILTVAGNETTRNAITHGMNAFLDNPDQYQALVDDPSLIDKAVEEIVRWASPVMYFRRNATADVEIRGQQIKAGDKLSIWYASANRDEEVFEDPFRFDIRRDPNPHIGFGGGGPHFCLGANLARMEIRVLFEELVRRVPRVEALGPPDRLRSNFIAGIKHLPVRFHATA